MKSKRIYGAPDLIIEEYWMIDPHKETILVYDYAHENAITQYHFSDKVPVGIYDGACEITFDFIRESRMFISGED